LNGKRLLGRKTVQLMTSEHVSEEMFTAHPSEKGYGFGLSVSVLLDPRRASNLASKGQLWLVGRFWNNASRRPSGADDRPVHDSERRLADPRK
jgi:hypothetical protein